ncbi:MAG: outer membrane beta-barrel protein [Flavobacteriaceae bacterium]|nr:outer membrane beta-barrel protein [Flavobacteriaceae bacterium]
MKEKKNIDNIFNEGFKNLEATPSPRVWENIQAELKKEKKERKVIPLWIKLSGVAALIALMLTVGNSLYNASDTGTPSITNENVKQAEKQLHENNSEIENQTNNSQVASEEKSLQNESTENSDASNDNTSKNKGETKPTSPADRSSDKVFKNASEKGNNTVIASTNSETVPADRQENSSKVKQNSQKELIEKNTSKNNLDEGIAAASKNSSNKINSGKNEKEANESIIKKDKEIFKQNKDGVVVNEKSETVPIDRKVNNSEKNLVKTEEEVQKDSENKKSIFDAIAETDEEVVAEKKKKQKPEHRWNVAPNVAPVYYSSFGNGSSIDPSFSDNPQKGDVNMSYGVQVSYALSNRLSVRAGVNNVDLSYSTTGIEVGTGPVSVALRSVDYGGSDMVVTVADKGSFANANSSNGFGAIMPKSTEGDARLIQNINYYEVPLELKYAVINNKIGVNVIGGVSTLFLGNNEISVKADNFTEVLGEANNLSSVSFSTNVGLGLDYKLSKKFTFNIEPMFKYQLNPYTDSSVNFKPYYLGVYSGLSFKF